MLPNGRRLGAHLPLGHGMVRAADRAAEIGASAIQVFSDNPTSWRRRSTLPHELPAFLARLADHDIAPLSIHAPYLVNLAGSEHEVFERSIGVLVHELRVATSYGAAFLNVHIGSHRGAGVDIGVARLALGLRRAFAGLDAGDGDDPDDGAAAVGAVEVGPGPVLVLENGSGGGYGLGSSIEELAAIDRAVADAGVPRGRFGFCLDAAHLWGAGYPIGDAAGVDDTLAAFDAQLGLDRLRMVHLNDSRAERGSMTDRHEHVGAGRIGAAGLARLITHPALGHVAYFIETPGMDEGYDAVNIRRVLDLAAGRALPDLPPEAFHARSSKGRSAPAEHHLDLPHLLGRRA